MASLKQLLAQKAAAPAAEGLTIKKDAPPPPPPPEPRPLGEAKEGAEDVPFDFPSATASEGDKEWLDARRAYASSLGLWIEPDGQHGWLAAESLTTPGKLILIHRLPLKNRVQEGQPY